MPAADLLGGGWAKTGRWGRLRNLDGPIGKVGWKKGAVEIWELACAGDCDSALLRCLLQPICIVARTGNGQVIWWEFPVTPLTHQMLALGFVEGPRSLCVLGKVFDPAKKLGEQHKAESINGAGQRVDVRINHCRVEIETPPRCG